MKRKKVEEVLIKFNERLYASAQFQKVNTISEILFSQPTYVKQLEGNRYRSNKEYRLGQKLKYYKATVIFL